MFLDGTNDFYGAFGAIIWLFADFFQSDLTKCDSILNYCIQEYGENGPFWPKNGHFAIEIDSFRQIATDAQKRRLWYQYA